MARNTFDTYCPKRVSYILVTKNRARYLEKTLLRVKKLLKHNDELIVVDGCSTDETLNVIKKYHSIIDKYISEPDTMPSHGVNKGILISQGKYIKPLADDDIIYKNAMEKAIAVLEAHPEVDVLECGGTRYRKSTKTWATIYRQRSINYDLGYDDLFNNGINIIGVIIRRGSISKIGLLPLNLLTDTLFLANCITAGANVKFCKIKLYHQPIREFTINAARTDELSKEFYSAVRKYASKKYFYRFAINWFLWKHPNIKRGLFLPFLIWNSSKLMSKTSTRGKKNGRVQYNWDASLS